MCYNAIYKLEVIKLKQVELRVKNGFPVIAQYRDYETAEDPDSGLFGTIEIVNVLTIKGKPADWFDLSEQDWTDIETACHEHSAGDFREDW